MLNGYKQFHNLDGFGPQDATTMSLQEKYRALRVINIIKEKRCGKINGSTCAYGIFQRTNIPWEEATSPTIALEALFASLLIDAHTVRAVHNFDVLGAYLHALLPDDKVLHMNLDG